MASRRDGGRAPDGCFFQAGGAIVAGVAAVIAGQRGRFEQELSSADGARRWRLRRRHGCAARGRDAGGPRPRCGRALTRAELSLAKPWISAKVHLSSEQEAWRFLGTDPAPPPPC